MPSLIIVGALWGDEAKGKLVDVLSESADYNVRFSGGNNAGHTVQAGGQTFKFHLLPSGILHSNVTCVLSSGMVVCPEAFAKEYEETRSRWPNLAKLIVSGAAHVVFPYHRTLDALEESTRGEGKIGTTSRGIGPAYQDKVARIGIRVWDFIDPERFERRLCANAEIKDRFLESHRTASISIDEMLERYAPLAAKIKPFVGEAELEVNNAIRGGKRVLMEGAQGALLDIDMGTYPFVTSSHPTAAGACLGSGLPPLLMDNVLGVCVAYTTRVGSGPFPTELSGDLAERIREIGREYGVSTGRPRRVGWLDLVALRHSCRMNGFSSLAVTRLDVLSGLDQVGVCTSYSLNGTRIETFPSDTELVSRCKPNFEYVSGWKEDITSAKRIEDLPEEVRNLISLIEKFTETPVSIASIGPDREQTILIRPDLLWG